MFTGDMFWRFYYLLKCCTDSGVMVFSLQGKHIPSGACIQWEGYLCALPISWGWPAVFWDTAQRILQCRNWASSSCGLHQRRAVLPLLFPDRGAILQRHQRWAVRQKPLPVSIRGITILKWGFVKVKKLFLLEIIQKITRK